MTPDMKRQLDQMQREDLMSRLCLPAYMAFCAAICAWLSIRAPDVLRLLKVLAGPLLMALVVGIKLDRRKQRGL